MKKRMYQVSQYSNTWSKCPTDITLEDFINMVRNGKWKIPVEGHRRCLAKGRPTDAKTIKDAMSCIVPAGTCRKGHAKSELTSLSMALCIDIDHTGEKTKDLFVRACLLEYVLGAFISISGTGIKLFIRIDIEQVNDYPAIYKAATLLVSSVLGVSNDEQCKDITHMCYGSYDPNAYYNPDAQAVNGFLPQGALTPRTTSFTSGHPPARTGEQVPVTSFVQSYLTLYPATTGDRNGTVFRLSCAACKRNIDRNELTDELIRQIAADTFPESEIARTVRSAYQTVVTAEETERPAQLPSNSTKFQNSNIGFPENGNPEKEEEEIIGEELRAHTPTFPDEIYDWIPSILKECVSINKDKRERDGLLLSSITTISSMFPNTTFHYNRRKYRLNLACIIIAPSGNNKGLISYGGRLHKHYNAYWEKLSMKAEKEYKKALKEYNFLLQAARKKNCTIDDIPDAPEEPRLQFPLIPTDISRAQLINHLINNEACSSLLTSTELSSVSTASKQDYGHFEDVLCRVFEHEGVGSSYKTNGQRPILADSPCMSAFFTGTPSSLVLLIPTMETGLFNRFLIYTYSSPIEWQDVFAEEEVSADDLFDELSMRFCQMALFLKDSPTEGRLTDAQKQEFNRVFAQLLKETDQLGNDDLLGVVKRYGVMTARICCIFSAIDKATMRMDTPEIYCSDAHFKAALAIVLCCFEHSKLVSTSVRRSSEEVKPLQSPDTLSRFLSKLPKEFSSKDAKLVGEDLSFSLSTVYNLLNKGIKTEKISKLSHGMYIQKT